MTTNRLTVALAVATLLIQVTIVLRLSGFFASDSTVAFYDAPDGTLLDITGMPTLGSPSAELVVVEFSDYECPFCQSHATSVLPQLTADYVASGQMRYAFANNPLYGIHPNAFEMATAAICAGQQGRYWAMHDRLFETQPKTKGEFLEIGAILDLDETLFERCIDARELHTDVIRRDAQKASDLELTVTPAFAIGRAAGESLVNVEVLVRGAKPLTTFQAAIDEILER